jgi:flagellar secretion chaperone FliS
MLDPPSAYRTTQVVGSSPVGQIILLYQGAIRFGVQHLAWLERHEIEKANTASIRAQEIVAALRGSLDPSAGQIAIQLDQLYDFVLRRMMDGNVKKDPRPTQEALQVLRGLLEGWQELAAAPATTEEAPAPAPAPNYAGSYSQRGLVAAGSYGAVRR